MAQKISQAVAAQMLVQAKGDTFFTVTFVKRTDGSLRTMNCRKGVKSHLAGGTLGYKPGEKALMSVFDVKSEGYRMVDLNTVTEIKMNGNTFVVEGR